MSDLLEELAEITREPYAGPAPLHFTLDYYTPDELIAAHVEASRDRIRSHTWDAGITTGWCAKAPAHSLCVLTSDLRCRCSFAFLAAQWQASDKCQCVGDLLSQSDCPECRWHAIGTEAAVVEAWHDHAWPGWRDLPVMPHAMRPHGGGMGTKNKERGVTKARDWVEANYPPEWQVDGAPVLTERVQYGTRHVPYYSPWGGFDLCARVIEVQAVAA